MELCYLCNMLETDLGQLASCQRGEEGNIVIMMWLFKLLDQEKGSFITSLETHRMPSTLQ